MKASYKAKASLKVRGMRLMIGLMRPMVIPTEFILHSDVGERYLGLSGLLALGILIFFCIPAHAAVMIVVTSWFVLKALGHQDSWKDRCRYGRSRQVTTRAGVPLWGLLRNKMTDEKAQACETWLLIGLSGLAAFFNQTAGPYLMISALLGPAIRYLREAIDRDVLLDRVDELLEEEELNRKVAEHLGPGWLGHHQVGAMDPKVIELLAQVTRRALPATAARNGELVPVAE